jgi:putative peptidoglycan lipid II flippase
VEISVELNKVCRVTQLVKDIVKIIYERGEFTSHDTQVVASLFTIYIIGTLVYAYRYIIRTAFYSAQNVKVPMINETVYLIVCIVCNLFQVKVLHLGLDALGIAWVISITITTPFLFLSFKRRYFSILTREVFFETIKAAISSIIAILVALGLGRLINGMSAYLNTALLLFVFAFVYCLFMILVKSKTLKDVFRVFVRTRK